MTATKSKKPEPVPAKPAPLNTTGIRPIEFNVLVAPKAVDKTTKGGIIIPELTKDRMQAAAVEGTVIALSPLAFSYDDWPDDQKPKVGDTVVYAKFAGMTIPRGDIEYRLIKDKDIAAVVRAHG